jgi:hypothetical protein
MNPNPLLANAMDGVSSPPLTAPLPLGSIFTAPIPPPDALGVGLRVGGSRNRFRGGRGGGGADFGAGVVIGTPPATFAADNPDRLGEMRPLIENREAVAPIGEGDLPEAAGNLSVIVWNGFCYDNYGMRGTAPRDTMRSYLSLGALTDRIADVSVLSDTLEAARIANTVSIDMGCSSAYTRASNIRTNLVESAVRLAKDAIAAKHPTFNFPPRWTSGMSLHHPPAPTNLDLDPDIVNQHVTIRLADYSLTVLEEVCNHFGFSLQAAMMPFRIETVTNTHLNLHMGPDAEAASLYMADFARLITTGGVNGVSRISLMAGTRKIVLANPNAEERPEWIKIAMTASYRYDDTPTRFENQEPVMIVITPPCNPFITIVAFGGHYGSIKAFTTSDDAAAVEDAVAAAYLQEGLAEEEAQFRIRMRDARSDTDQTQDVLTTAVRGLMMHATPGPIRGALRRTADFSLPFSSPVVMSAAPSAPLATAAAVARMRYNSTSVATAPLPNPPS